MATDRRYWDSVCFLAQLKGEEGRIESCEAVLSEAEDGRIQIVTSALTIAEVINHRGSDPIPDSKRADVERFFRNEYIAIRNITRRTAEYARELVWDHGIKPKDALHVAAAVEGKLPLLNTFDDELLKKSGTYFGHRLLIEKPAVDEPPLPLFEKKEDDAESEKPD